MQHIRTVPGQDDSDVLLAEGADGQQHGGTLGGEETEGHVLSGSAALPGHTGGLRAPVLHDREGLLEGVGHRGLPVEGHRHLCARGGGRRREKRRKEGKKNTLFSFFLFVPSSLYFFSVLQ